MTTKTLTEEEREKLPNKGYDISVEANLKAAEEKLESLGGNFKERVKRQAKGHIKRRIIKGRPYYYHVIKVKVDGKWKNKEEYLGTRKPRDYKGR